MKTALALALSLSLFNPFGLSALAGDTPLSAGRMDNIQLSPTFSGMTMIGNYADGMKFEETYHPDGTITYSDDDSQDKGHWFVRGRLFCTFYDTANGACFSVRKSGDNCYEYFTEQEEDGVTHADAGAWNSVGWDKAKPTSCDLSDKTS